jgi:hypothetical protein
MVLYMTMSKTNYLLSMDTLKTISQGALGAMTFGAYHQYTSNKIMELNNEKQNLQQKCFIEKMENQHKKETEQHKKEMEELKEKLNSIEQKRWWY